MMDITPPAEFREACRRILGGDDPRTVLSAMMSGDPRMDLVRSVHADILLEKEGKRPMHVERLRREREKQQREADELMRRLRPAGRA